jgi:TolB-like protein/Flp pilus assembly protein TadD
MNIFQELKRRNVFRVGIAYLLFAWVIIQVTDTVAPVMRLPEWTLALVTWFTIIGFPVALLFAWAFELTPDGIVRDKDVDHSQSITESTGQKINHVVVGLLVIAVVFLVVQNYVLTDDPQPVADSVEPEDTDGVYNSIGVLPFVNMSDDPSQEYFSDGISEELLNTLAKLKNLQVAARTSSFAFKGQNQDITNIGQQLNVDTVLEGSVRKSGNKLRITAQLIDVENGYHLWSETYDRELVDVFAVQDEITAAIVEALLLHFDTGEDQELAASKVTNMSAYDAYLQGRHYFQSTDGAERSKALELFRAATEADPEFAPAWAARAVSILMNRENLFNEGVPRTEARILARSNIDKALAIDPLLAEAHVAEGMLHEDDYRFEDALQSLEKAVEINPNLADAWTLRSRILGRFGRIREAQENMLKALRLDPHNVNTAFFATNLASDFYEPEFFTKVEQQVAQFFRPKMLMQWQRWTTIEPMTTERYQSIVATPDLPPSFKARLDYWMLAEMDEEVLSKVSRQPGEVVMWNYMTTDRWEKAQAMYDALPEDRQQAEVNLEELSVMQASQGNCEKAVETLRQAHGDELRVYGLINTNAARSNSNLALNRAYCLRQLGDTTKADEILSAVGVYVQTLRENTVFGFYTVDAKYRILQGDIEGALDVLETARKRNETSWTTRYDPVLRTLRDEPRFQAIFAEIDRELNALRTGLQMPPVNF